MSDIESMTYRDLAELNLIDKQALREYIIFQKYGSLIKQGLKAREAEDHLTKFEKIQDNETTLKYFFIRMEFEELKKEMGATQALNYLADTHFRSKKTIEKIVYLLPTTKVG
jgi:hypothetical protein